MTLGSEFIIHVSTDAMLKLIAISEQSGANEVGGLLIGHISPNNPGRIVISDITVPKQEVTGASIDFDDESINEQLSELFFNEFNDGFIGWWHTHGTGNVFWSSTDQNDGINKFLAPLVDNPDTDLSTKWIVSVVMNASGDMLGRIDYYHVTPFGAAIQSVDDITITTLPEVTPAHREWADGVIKQQTKTKKNVYRYRGKKSRGTWYGSYYGNDDVWAPLPSIDSDERMIWDKVTKEESKLLRKAVKEHPDLELDDVEVLNEYGYSIKDAVEMLTGSTTVYPDAATFLARLTEKDVKKVIELTTDHGMTYAKVMELYFDGLTFDQMLAGTGDSI